MSIPPTMNDIKAIDERLKREKGKENAMRWTIEKVKQELPDVPVGKMREPWRLAGRMNKFATLYHPQTGQEIDTAWITIVHVLNTGGTIKI